MQQQPEIVLIYYKIRGKLQAIRTLLCYLSLSFREIHLEQEHFDRQNLPSRLNGLAILKKKLPLMVIGDELIYGLIPIMVKLCIIANRTDLLGQNETLQYQLRMMLAAILPHQNRSKSMIFELASSCYSATQDQIKFYVEFAFLQLMENSLYLRELTQLLFDGREFLLGDLTILDFIFAESCHYMIGIFGRLDQRPLEELSLNFRMIQVMRQFRQRVLSLQNLREHLDFLNSFSILFLLASQERREGIKKIWVGQPTSVK